MSDDVLVIGVTISEYCGRSKISRQLRADS